MLPHVNTECMQLFIAEIGRRHPDENIWEELREKYFHNQAFDSLDALEDQLVAGSRRLEQQPQIVRSIAAWDWIGGDSSRRR